MVKPFSVTLALFCSVLILYGVLQRLDTVREETNRSHASRSTLSVSEIESILASFGLTLGQVEEIRVFDYLIFGGGTAGCATAGSLAEAGYETVIIEGGPMPENTYDPQSVLNADNHKWLEYNTQVEKNFIPVPQRVTLSNGTVVTIQGKIRRGSMLRGCGGHNGVLFDKGINVFDAWNVSGWRARDLLAYFDEIKVKLRGAVADGFRSVQSLVMNQWSNNLGYRIIPDRELDEWKQNGLQRNLFNLDKKNTTYYGRITTCDAYVLKSRKLGSKLFVHTGMRVDKVLPQYEAGESEPRIRAALVTNTTSGRVYLYLAEYEVQSSLGVFDTASLLMRSGIGNCTALQAMGIDCLVDNSHVGASFYYHRVLAALTTVNPQYAQNRSNVQFDTQVRVAFSDQGESYPTATIDFQMQQLMPPYFTSPYLPNPTGFAIILSDRDFGPGTMTLDPSDHYNLMVDLKLFQQSWEKPHMVRLFKEYRRLLAANTVYQYEISPGMDKVATDDQINDYVALNNDDGAHHYASCPLDKVVDKRLRVMGTRGFRIADASVFKTGNHGNINWLVAVIGRKSADLLLADARRWERK